MESWRRPRRAVPFLDREEPRRLIAEHLMPARNGPSVVCVHALYGAGSYSLAAEACHEYLRRRQDAGYLEVQARELDGGPVSLGELLAQALRGLGHEERDLPVSDAARSDTYQRLAAGRHFVLVVRDAVTAEQFEQLVPHSARHAAVVVTSRTVFRALSGRDVLYVPVTQLPGWAARELFDARLREGSELIDQTALDDILTFCAGHPLTIEMLAGHLRGRPHAAVALVDKIRRADSEVLELPVMDRIVLAFDLAHAGLTDRLRDTLAQVAWIPGPDFTAATAACAGDVAESTAVERLDDLVDAGLLSVDAVARRYRLYPVLREQVRRLARDSLGTQGAEDVVARVVDWMLAQAVAPDAALSDRWRIGPVFAAHERAGRPRPTRDDAIAWWEVEWRGVVECVAAANEIGRHDIAAQLCIASFKFLHMHCHVEAGLRCHDIGVVSAGFSGDPEPAMQVLMQRGTFRLMLGSTDQARADFHAALSAARDRHPLAEESCQEWLGKIAAQEGDLEGALDLYDAAEAVIDGAGPGIPPDQAARMRALLDLQRARARVTMTRWAAAAALARRASAHFDTTEERENRAKCLIVLGAALAGQGEQASAADAYLSAVEFFVADGLRRPAASAWRDAGALLDDPVRARELLERAAQLFAELGDAAEDEVRRMIDGLGGEVSGGS